MKYISAEDRFQMSSSVYLCLGPKKDPRVICSWWEIGANDETTGIEIGINFCVIKGKKEDKNSPSLINHLKKKLRFSKEGEVLKKFRSFKSY